MSTNLEDPSSNDLQDSSSSRSTSSSDTESDKDIEADDIKLTQMRRRAKMRVKHAQTTTQVAGLQSYDQMVKAHALQRMTDGMLKILSLHTPVELSSLCGTLELKVQEKGSTSIDLIMKWLSFNKEMEEAKVKKVLNFMWEGALWEYLHSIGHPVHNIRIDPKVTIFELWCEGGLIDDTGGVRGFVPHFVAREVKKRNDWVQSEDIQQRLEKLRVAQDACKEAERKVISEHDYTNILRYFNQMGALRRLENSVREYLMSELEIARSRVDSGQDTAQMLRKQLTECERLATEVSNNLNEQLGQCEFVCEAGVRERMELERDLQRMDQLLQSYIDAEINRQEPGGGTMRALKLRHVELSSPGVRAVHNKLQRYRNMRDTMDSAHRANARLHEDELARLAQLTEDLQAEVAELSDYSSKENARADKAERELFFCRRQLVRAENRHDILAKEAWESGFRTQGKLLTLQRTVDNLRPLLLASLRHGHPTVYRLSRTLLETFKLSNKATMDHVFETACMARADAQSCALRQAEIERRNAIGSSEVAAARARGMKGKLGKKGVRGGGTGSKASSKANSRASTPTSSRPGTAASTGTGAGSVASAKKKKKKGSSGGSKATAPSSSSASVTSSTGKSKPGKPATAGKATPPAKSPAASRKITAGPSPTKKR